MTSASKEGKWIETDSFGELHWNTGEGTAVLRHDGRAITSGWLLLVELGGRAWGHLMRGEPQ